MKYYPTIKDSYEALIRMPFKERNVLCTYWGLYLGEKTCFQYSRLAKKLNMKK